MISEYFEIDPEDFEDLVPEEKEYIDFEDSPPGIGDTYCFELDQPERDLMRFATFLGSSGTEENWFYHHYTVAEDNNTCIKRENENLPASNWLDSSRYDGVWETDHELIRDLHELYPE